MSSDRRLSVVNLATRLDYQSRETAFSIVSQEWWVERTAGRMKSA
jgi:hypothetical protein